MSVNAYTSGSGLVEFNPANPSSPVLQAPAPAAAPASAQAAPADAPAPTNAPAVFQAHAPNLPYTPPVNAAAPKFEPISVLFSDDLPPSGDPESEEGIYRHQVEYAQHLFQTMFQDPPEPSLLPLTSMARRFLLGGDLVFNPETGKLEILASVPAGAEIVNSGPVKDEGFFG